jgi:hypothetical protein
MNATTASAQFTHITRALTRGKTLELLGTGGVEVLASLLSAAPALVMLEQSGTILARAYSRDKTLHYITQQPLEGKAVLDSLQNQTMKVMAMLLDEWQLALLNAAFLGVALELGAGHNHSRQSLMQWLDGFHGMVLLETMTGNIIVRADAGIAVSAPLPEQTTRYRISRLHWDFSLVAAPVPAGAAPVAAKNPTLDENQIWQAFEIAMRSMLGAGAKLAVETAQKELVGKSTSQIIERLQQKLSPFGQRVIQDFMTQIGQQKE